MCVLDFTVLLCWRWALLKLSQKLPEVFPFLLGVILDDTERILLWRNSYTWNPVWVSYIAVAILGPSPWGFLTHATRLEGFPCILFSNLEVDAIIFKSLDRRSTSIWNNLILGALAMCPVLTRITKQVLSLCWRWTTLSPSLGFWRDVSHPWEM